MKKNHITRTIIASAVLFSFNAAAATSYFEARNDAMGGTGVASSHYGVAPLANPALLTKHNSNDDFSLLLPSVGAQVADPDDVSPRFYVSTSKSIIKALINMHSFEIQLSPIG